MTSCTSDSKIELAVGMAAFGTPTERESSPSGKFAQTSAETNTMKKLNRIVVDSSIRFGKPCVRGTRVTVGEVLGFLAEGGTEADLIEDFPQLTHEDVLACFGFAAERERRLLVLPAA
jgi:uncharacterized protein (DUF433 family)